MKKNFKKRMCALMSVVLVFGLMVLSACGGGGGNLPPDFSIRDEEEVDTARTQLYVANYNGGIGDQWLYNAKEEFEAQNPGVQIMINNGKDELDTTYIMQNYKTTNVDLYIMDSVAYYTLANAGVFMDITNLVTSGTDSLEGRMNESLKNFYKTPQSKYYAVPFYEAFYHMTYDVDLFDEKLFWLNESGTGFVNSLDEPRYPGLSGESGAWDEGLPRTYSQFFMLLDRMVEYGVIPLTWSGKHFDPYIPYFLDSLIADYEGAENFMTRFNYQGNVKVLKDSNFTDAPTGTYAMNASNYEVKSVNIDTADEAFATAAGAYYATKFSKDIMSNGYQYVNRLVVNSDSETHTLAQDTFLRSRYLGKPIGMLIDGGWWYNEAKVTMDAMALEYGNQWSASTRRLGVMPFPKADDGSSAEGRTYAATGGSCVAINSQTDQKELAEKFFNFIHTPEAMTKFTLESKVRRPYTYPWTAENAQAVPYYINNLFKATASGTVVYMVPNASISPELLPHQASLFSLYGSRESGIPMLTFFNDTTKTAASFFKDMKTFYATNGKLVK